jgi:D-glycero-alpha-D-manno-heptose 1-phosphate guanylyltransferase
VLETAIILAGGFGTRLKTVISDLPKPMAPVNGEPFLNYQLNYLKHFGVKQIVLSVGHMAEKIQEYYGPEYNGLKINYVVENTPLGTGGAIRLALELNSNNNEVLVLNGDSFFDVDLNRFYDLHSRERSQFSLALRKVTDASRYGTIEKNQEHLIISFKEKKGAKERGIINGGIYILNRELYLANTPTANFSIEKDFFEKHLNDLAIKGFEFDGYFIDIGIPEDYTKAQYDLKGFKYR